MAEDRNDTPKDQNVSIPIGLIPELMQWVEDELNYVMTGTAYRRDLSTFYDRLDAANPARQG